MSFFPECFLFLENCYLYEIHIALKSDEFMLC
jgi:hypothetical protein